MKKCIKNSKICLFGGDFEDNFGYRFSRPIEDNHDNPTGIDYDPFWYLSSQNEKNYQLSGYPIPDNGAGPINDPCSRTYDPFSYLGSRGDRVEPFYDPLNSNSSFEMDLSPNPEAIIQDLIPISRFSSMPVYNINLPYANDYIPISNCCANGYPSINDIIPISRFSPRGDRVEPDYLCETLDNPATMIWDPYVHDFVPEFSKTTEIKSDGRNTDVPEGTYFPSIPVEPTRAYSDRCFC